jgi:hypothetical protein
MTFSRGTAMPNRLAAFRAVARIQGRRPFVYFGAVTAVVVFLLAALQIASRTALKEYVEDQLARIAWDVSLYQVGELRLAPEVARTLAGTRHVSETQSIFFLRTAVPTTTVAHIDGQPLRSPWLSLLSVTHPGMLPPELRPQGQSALLVLVGSKAQMGDAFLQLQNRRRFELRVERHGKSALVFGVPLERTLRLERNEINRWFMDQTSSPTLVPELGVILVAPYDAERLAAFDAVSRGLKLHSHGDEPDDIHADAGEYFPDIIHLARLERPALVSGWDIDASRAHLDAVGRELRARAQAVTFRIGMDNTAAVLFERMGAIARVIGLVSLLAALPLLWMAWVLLANLSALLMFNSRRQFGLLRLRGVPGALLGRSMLVAIAAGGLAGGLLGAVLGTVLPILVYARGWLPWNTVLRIQNPTLLAACVLIGVALALLVSLRLARYAATISPLEASARVAASEAAHGTVHFRWLECTLLILGAAKVLSWAGPWPWLDSASPAWARGADRALDFAALPFFVYGATTLLASRRRWLAWLLRPMTALAGGKLARVSLTHAATRAHRVSAVLLIVALLAAVSLYPTVMNAVFDDKTERAAKVQLGAPLQVTLSVPDLVPPAALAQQGLRERYEHVRTAAERLAARISVLKEVRTVGYLVEGLVDGLYLPGHGFNSLPLYLVTDADSYLRGVYHERALGETAPFNRLVRKLDSGDVLISSALDRFWQRAPGKEMPVGRDIESGMASAPLGGVVRLLPGVPPTAVKDRESFVAARVDYLNYLFDNRPQLAAAAGNPAIARLDALLPRLVLAITPASGVDVDTLARAVVRVLPAEPVQVRTLPDEVGRLGSDMYIFLARRNVQIYLVGGLLLAIVGILAIAAANHAEDRRTLGLLRIRGGGPRHLLQFLAATLSAPAVAGLVLGALIALLAGYGITNLLWQLRELKTVVVYLTTHLAVSAQTALVGAALVAVLAATLGVFTRWIYNRTAREGLSDR